LCQIIECFIASSVAKDCLALSQNDLHHGTFLLVTPKVMPSYKSTIIQRKSTSLQWHAVFSKLCSKVKKTPSLPPYVEDVLFVNKPGVTSFRVVTYPQLWAVFSFVHLPIVLSDPVLVSSEKSETFKVTHSNLTSKYSCPILVQVGEASKVCVFALLYRDQVYVPILLSVSSAVVLVTSEALKGQTNQSCLPCQCHVPPDYVRQMMRGFPYLLTYVLY